MPTLLCFGDSNTHGTPPMEARGAVARLGPADRWPRVAAGLLDGWDVVEEGLPGRTAQFPDPVMGAHMDGRMGLRIALGSHGPVDVLAIMLGTNDVKTRFGADARTVAAGIAGLLDIALSLEVEARHPGMRVLVMCPPPVLEQGPIAGEFLGARETALGLAPLYEALARARGAGFLDAGGVAAVSPLDGIHLDAAAQRALGEAAAAAVRAL